MTSKLKNENKSNRIMREHVKCCNAATGIFFFTQNVLFKSDVNFKYSKTWSNFWILNIKSGPRESLWQKDLTTFTFICLQERNWTSILLVISQACLLRNRFMWTRFCFCHHLHEHGTLVPFKLAWKTNMPSNYEEE